MTFRPRFTDRPQRIAMLFVLGIFAVSSAPNGGRVFAAERVGTITGASGESFIERDGRQYSAKRGADVLKGDEFETGDGGQATIYLDTGQVVYVGEKASLAFEAVDADPHANVILLQGEFRLTNIGRSGLNVHSRTGLLNIPRGIVRVVCDTSVTVAEIVQGNVVATPLRGQAVRLRAGQWCMLNGEVNVHSATEERLNWSIDVKHHQVSSIGRGESSNTIDLVQFEEAVAPEQLPPGTAGASGPDDIGDEPLRSDETRGSSGVVQRTPQDAARGRNANRNANGRSKTASTGSVFGSGLATSSSGGQSGGGQTDANQDSLQGMLTTAYNGITATEPFPGNIHLVTAETGYSFDGVELLQSETADLTGVGEFWSIGLGAQPTAQVFTDFLSATNAVPATIEIPGFDAYLVRLDQMGLPDFAATDPTATSTAITGMLGDPPVAPMVVGATPLADQRGATGSFNQFATFALGEFGVRIDPNDPDSNSPQLSIRRSDQDRLIEKDPNGNDALDKVTVNPDIASFDDVVDPRFLPATPTVKSPSVNAFDAASTRFSNLNTIRRAAVTTLMADKLKDFSRRTGQTRFAIDNRVIDISGYQP